MARDHSPAGSGKPTGRDALLVCGLAALGCVIWAWNVVYSGDVLFSLANFDLYAEFYPRHAYAGESLRHGMLPLWDPHQIAGLPFLATYQAGVLYPPNLLYAVLPTGMAMGLLGLLHVAATGAFTYLLAREFGRSRVASCLAGVTFMAGGCTLFMSFHTNALNSVPWLPASLYCASRLGRTPDLRWSVSLAACVALQFLAGRDFTFVMTLHTLALFAAFQLVWMFRDGAGAGRVVAHLSRLGLAGALAIGLVAAQALPTLVLAAQSGRSISGLEGNFLEIYDPMPPALFLANLLNPVRSTIRREYIGWIPLVAFLLGFRLWGRERPVVFASLLSLFSLLLCFGSQTPLYAGYRWLPLGATFRLPDRFVFLFGLGAALVAASGFDRLIEPFAEVRRRLRALAPRAATLLVATVLLSAAVRSDWFEVGLANAARPWTWFAFYGFDAEQFASLDRFWVYFAAAVLLLALTAWRGSARGGRILQWSVVACAAADLAFALHNTALHPAHDATPALSASSCYARLPAVTGALGRHLSLRIPQSYALKDKDGELFGRYSATHYDPLVTRRQAAYFAALLEGGEPLFPNPWVERSLFMGFLTAAPRPERIKLLDLLGTRAVLVDGRPQTRPAALEPMLERFQHAGRCRVGSAEGPVPVDVYANPRALPRAFVVHRFESVSDPEAALRRLVEPAFDPRREALVEAEVPFPAGSSSGRSRVGIPVYEPTRVVVRLETSEPGLLVLTDSYDPDWVATRNGEAVSIHATDGLFRGVFVPAGRSDVVFRYRPLAFRWGAAVTGATLLLAALLWRRRRPDDAASGAIHPS